MKCLYFNGKTPNTRLLNAFFRLRKRVFIDELQWQLEERAGLECDQYDHEHAHYILILSRGTIIAGNRFLATSTQKNGYSYMIKDAQEGRLPSLPQNLVNHAPAADDIYEITRFAIEKNLAIFEQKRALRSLIMGNLSFLNMVGAQSVIGLTHIKMHNLLRAARLDVQEIGPRFWDHGREYSVIHHNVPSTRKTLFHVA